MRFAAETKHHWPSVTFSEHARFHRGRLGSVVGTILVPISLEGTNQDETGTAAASIHCETSEHLPSLLLSVRQLHFLLHHHPACVPEGLLTAAQQSTAGGHAAPRPDGIIYLTTVNSAAAPNDSLRLGTNQNLNYFSLRSNENHGGPISASRVKSEAAAAYFTGGQ